MELLPIMKVKTIQNQEDPEQSCRSILFFIKNNNLEGQARTLLFQDIATKMEFIRPEAKDHFLGQLFLSTAPKEIKEIFMNIEQDKLTPKPNFDVGIVTTTTPELDAVKIAFGITRDQREDRYIEGYRFWEVNLVTTSEKNNCHIVITKARDQGDKESFNVCNRLFSTYSIKLCVLIGIAAGLPEKLSLGDVISAKKVIDYENQRLEPKGPKYRPDHFSPPNQILNDLSYFEPGKYEFQSVLLESIRSHNLIYKDDSRFHDYSPKYKKCVLFSGDKLFADGKSLSILRNVQHEEGLAGDKEGSGFAFACEEANIPWLIFKAVSDFGDPNKPNSDNYQKLYALGAAISAKLFLENDYHFKENR
jgi:nucleoside phosphorylase